MSIVTQLPRLYLRGSLANQTMMNLTKQEMEKIDNLFLKIMKSDALVAHKQRYSKILRQTIGSDYKSPEAAEQDFMIVVWRGVVMLYSHYEYKFQCRYCKSSTYTNKTGATSEICRCEKICPNCDADSSVGISPIKAIKIKRKHTDPDSIINDESQFSKWFSTLVSNATGQQLRENPITQLTTTINTIDYADKQIVSSLFKILSSHKIRARKIETVKNGNLSTSVFFEVTSIPSKVVGLIIELKHESARNCVSFEINNGGIDVGRTDDSKFVPMSVTEKAPVSITLQSQHSNSEYNSLDVADGYDSLVKVETRDTMYVLLDLCPDEMTRKYMQILMEYGEGYNEYVEVFGEKKPSMKNARAFFNVSKNKILDMKDEIGRIMMRIGMHRYV